MESGGIKINDLSVFRNASHSRSVNILHTGGDVFITSATSSDSAVLWGESFGAKERKFLRELMTAETVNFSLEDNTFQMHVRTLWHATSMTTQAGAAMQGLRRQGKFALLLHDLKGELTTSWAFAKFIRPLYRRNFSVLAADLPGFGKSAVSQICSCPLSRWLPFSSHIITKIMEELGLTKCHIMAVGHAAGMLIQIMQNTPHRCEGRHVIVNPVFDRNQLFGHVGSDLEPPPGAKAGWREEIKERQMAEFIKMVRTNGIKLWFIFDRDGKHRDFASGKEAPNSQTRKEWEQAYDAHEFLVSACKDEFASLNVKMTEVTSSDLCEAQCGKKVPVRMLIPSRHLKSSVTRYLSDYWQLQWEEAYMPRHVMQTMKDGRKVNQVFGLANDEDDSENELDDAHEGAALALKGSSSPPSNQLQVRRVNTMQSSASSGNFRAIEGSATPQRNASQRAIEGSATPQRNASKRAIEGFATPQRSVSKGLELSLTSPQRSVRSVSSASKPMSASNASNYMGASNASNLMRSASESPLRPSSRGAFRSRDSTLGAAAIVAKERLRMSGALTQPAPISAQAARDAKQMSWSQVPYEPDLSYGVRKMFLDAFEASVDSYKEEQEKEMFLQEKHRIRSAFRVNRGQVSDAEAAWKAIHE